MFYRKIGKRINSQTLQAAFADSRNDILCTAAVLVAAIIEHFTDVILDGYIGLLVALFVLWSGFSIIKGTITPLLGQKPDAELVRQIKETVLQKDGVLGIHDLVVHSYGANRYFVTVHVEIDADASVMHSHDLMDVIEADFLKDGINLVIHMDPISVSDPETKELREQCEKIVEILI